MKKVLCLFLLFPVITEGQIVYDFESGSLDPWVQSDPGRWEASQFTPLSGERSLHHAYDNPNSGVDWIFLETGFNDAQSPYSIAFTIRHGYNPSGSNNWQLFCIAQGHNFSDPTNVQAALVLGVNYQGNDDMIKLWRLDNGEITERFNTGLNYQKFFGTDTAVAFSIYYDSSRTWKLGYQLPPKDSFVVMDSHLPIESIHGKYLGFRYAYTSSQDQKLWIDDVVIEGHFYHDTIPPQVNITTLEGQDKVFIAFSERLASPSPFSFSRNGTYPDSIHHNSDEVTLYFSASFPNRKEESILLRGIRDIEGNRMPDTTVSVRLNLPRFGDVVINEIMADPEPTVYLPPHEYIELFNRFSEPFTLTGWTLEVNDRQYSFRGIAIEPGGYLVCNSGANTDTSDGARASIFTSAYTLPNDGAELRLYDQYHRLIHYAEYAPPFPDDRFKAEGGWSLERIDSDYLCGEAAQWSYSSNSHGGTPGKFNSIYSEIDDHSAPFISHIGITPEAQIQIHFNELVFADSMSSIEFYINASQVMGFEHIYPFASKTYSIFPGVNDSIEEEIFDLLILGAQDCSGNRKDSIMYNFSLPIRPEKRSVLISEVMYDPGEEGFEYFELLNHSDQWTDLYDLSFSISDPGDLTARRHSMVSGSRLMAPKSYSVLCKNGTGLKNYWDLSDHADVVELSAWKTIPNDGSCIRIFDRSGMQIDAVCFHDSLHMDLLSDTRGVALERIVSECDMPGFCWTSAAASKGYGTPGEENSQWRPDRIPGSAEELFTLSPKVFSPDCDGFADVCLIELTDADGYALYDIHISDLSGTYVRSIVQMANPGLHDRYSWDGKDASGYLVAPGIYIVHCRLMGPSGEKVARIPCAVTYR